MIYSLAVDGFDNGLSVRRVIDKACYCMVAYLIQAIRYG